MNMGRSRTGKTIVKIDPKYFRPIEVDESIGNSEKAIQALKWKPKTSFQELIKIMIAEDFKIVLQEAI